MKKSLSFTIISILMTLTIVLISADAFAAPANSSTNYITKLYSMFYAPHTASEWEIQHIKKTINLDGMDVLILFISAIISLGLLKMADSLASTFGGDSGAGQISSNVSQSMTMLGGTAISKTWGAAKTAAGLGVAGAWAGLKGLGKKGNKFDAGGGDESKPRTPDKYDGNEKNPDSKKNEKQTSPQPETPPPTNDKDKPSPQGDEKRDNPEKNAHDNEEKKEEKTGSKGNPPPTNDKDNPSPQGNEKRDNPKRNAHKSSSGSGDGPDSDSSDK